MVNDSKSSNKAHLRAIRSTIAALALAVLAAALILHDEPLAFPFLIATIVVLIYSFVPTLLHS